MKLQILSDVHLELRRDNAGFDFPAAAPYLALLGDIGNPAEAQYAHFLQRQADRFEKVFVVAGNHCHYGRTPQDTAQLLRGLCSARVDKLVYLDRDRYDIDEDYAVLGCTLWSHVTDAQRRNVGCFIADHRCIKDWSVDANNAAHAQHVAWLQTQLAAVAREGRRAVVLTHHSPSHKNTSSPAHAHSPLTSAFATSLEHLIRPPVALWAYGHTHYSSNQRINGVPVVSNQVGYPGEGVAFDPAFTVEV